MSNNMCSMENVINGVKHSMPAVTSSLSSPYATHYHPLFSNLSLHLPDTAFPFPPPSIFLSSLLPHQTSGVSSSPSWFPPPAPPPAHTHLAPISLTANDSNSHSNINVKANENTITVKDDSQSLTQTAQRRISSSSSPNRDSSSDALLSPQKSPQTSSSMSDNKLDKNLSSSNNFSNNRHSDNLSWLADVAVSSRAQLNLDSSNLPNGSNISMDQHNTAIVAAQRGNLFHSSHSSPLLPPSESPRNLYSPRFPTGANSHPSMFHFPPVPQAPPAHFSNPYMSSLSAYHQQFSPSSAQNPISPFIVPNSSCVPPTTNARTYHSKINVNLSESSYHNLMLNHMNHHSMTSNPPHHHLGLQSTPTRSPTIVIHPSGSPSNLNSGRFSSSIMDSQQEQAKSLVMTNRSSHSPKEEATLRINAKTASTENMNGIKRKSPLSGELNDKNVYKIPSGKEGSLKHRILKPPNINIGQTNHIEAAPFSAPPIPAIRRDEFFSRINSQVHGRGYSEGNSLLSESIHPQNYSQSTHQRRKSVSHVLSVDSLLDDPHKKHSMSFKETQPQPITPNENSVPQKTHEHLHYPMCFHKGSLILLANGKVKPVEDMSTQDFIESATQSADLCADCSKVVKIEDKIANRSKLICFSVGRNKMKITVEAPVEHPFFVFEQGWSSCCPQSSLQRYGLKCRKLMPNDICVSLTPKSSTQTSTTTSNKLSTTNANKCVTNDDNNNVASLNHKLTQHNMSSILATHNDKSDQVSNITKTGNEDQLDQKQPIINSSSSLSVATIDLRRHSAPDSS